MARDEDLERRVAGGPAGAGGERSGGKESPASKARVGRGSRLAFAGATSVVMIGVFISFGGLSYAASQSASAVQVLKKVTSAQKVVVHHSSADDQYPTQTDSLLPPKQTPPPSGSSSQTPPPSGPSSGTSPATTTHVAQASTLPFTGLSLVGTALVSALLLALGIVLRRRERRGA